jgi:hypothetical protein
MVYGFDDFVAGPQIDEVADIGWLDSWAMERERAFPMVSSRTIEYRFHRDDIGGIHAKPIACDILGNALACPIACDSVVKMPKCGPMPKWLRTSNGQFADDVYSDDCGYVSGDLEMNLRQECFVAMLDRGILVGPEDFNRVMKMDSPLAFILGE